MKKSTCALGVLVLVAIGCGGDKPQSLPPPTPVPAAPPPVAGPAPVPAPAPAPAQQARNVPASELTWFTPPDSKDIQFAVAWGDMQKTANGFFIKMTAGSPGSLHMHTLGYRAVVVDGTVTNAVEGDKSPRALPPGSYWSQAGGQPHTTACKAGKSCIAYVEFDGPADFKPATPAPATPDKKAGETPAPAGAIPSTTTPIHELKWASMPDMPGPKFAPAWGDPKAGPNGFYLKLPAGSASPLHTHTASYHGVVLAGVVTNAQEGQTDAKQMPFGSYWYQPGTGKHITSCSKGTDCIIYVHFEGAMDFTAVAAPPPAPPAPPPPAAPPPAPPPAAPPPKAPAPPPAPPAAPPPAPPKAPPPAAPPAPPAPKAPAPPAPPAPKAPAPPAPPAPKAPAPPAPPAPAPKQ